MCKQILSHNNPCFPCNIAIMNFLILYMCKIRFYDVIDRTVNTFTPWRHPTQNFQNMAKWVCFGPLLFNLICLTQLCDKKNLTFVDCWDKILLNLSWKTLLSSPKARLITFSKTHSIKFYLLKGSLNNIVQDSFNKILSQQLTHDRSYICVYVR